jgi:hypothetical protein
MNGMRSLLIIVFETRTRIFSRITYSSSGTFHDIVLGTLQRRGPVLAAEACSALHIPEIDDAQESKGPGILDRFLEQWRDWHPRMFCVCFLGIRTGILEGWLPHILWRQQHSFSLCLDVAFQDSRRIRIVEGPMYVNASTATGILEPSVRGARALLPTSAPKSAFSPLSNQFSKAYLLVSTELLELRGLLFTPPLSVS